MTFFYGSNLLSDTILKRYILDNENFIYTSPADIDLCNKIVISINQDSWPLKKQIIDLIKTKKTYIFFDIFSNGKGIHQGLNIKGKNIVLIHFRSLSGIMENIYRKGLVPDFKTPYCDQHILFRQLGVIFDLKPGTYHMMSGEIPDRFSLEKYFDRKEIKQVFSISDIETVIKKDGYDIFNIKTKRIHIYIPTYYRVEKAKKSILSIIEGAKNSKHDCHIYVGDNNTKDPEMSQFLDTLDTQKQNITLLSSSENLGKARMVNLLHSKQDHKPDYIFSIDSDMVMTQQSSEQINQIDGMIQLIERGHNIGLVSSFQTGQSEHWLNRTVIQKKERGYLIGESLTGVGIAGGCICIRADDWDLIEGYEQGYDIYTADDAILMEKVDKILKKRAVIGMDFPFYHPPNTEDDQGYTDWKKNRFQKDGLNYSERGYRKEDFGKGYYD